MSNVKPLNPSNLDQYQMDNMSFDVEKGAWRMTVVDGLAINVNNLQIDGLDKLNKEVQTIQIPEIIKETQIEQISIPVIVKETVVEKVEVPVIVKEIEYKTIEIPVIVPEIRVVEIEKPVVIKEIILKELPILIKVCIILQALGMIGLMLVNLLK